MLKEGEGAPEELGETFGGKPFRGERRILNEGSSSKVKPEIKNPSRPGFWAAAMEGNGKMKMFLISVGEIHQRGGRKEQAVQKA